MTLQMYVSNALIYFYLLHFFRQWLGLFIAGIDKDMLLDEIENKMHNLVENAKPANFNSTANDNNGDNKNDSDGDDKDDSEENNETDG